MLRLAADPKRWMRVTVPVAAGAFESCLLDQEAQYGYIHGRQPVLLLHLLDGAGDGLAILLGREIFPFAEKDDGTKRPSTPSPPRASRLRRRSGPYVLPRGLVAQLWALTSPS